MLPTVLRRPFVLTEASRLRSPEPSDPMVLEVDPNERRLLVRLNGVLINVLRPRFPPRFPKRPDPVPAETEPEVVVVVEVEMI